MENTLTRIKEYIDFKGVSVRKFEKSVGLSNGSFASQLKNNKTIGVDRVENILQYYKEINPEWLLTGKGEMLKNNNTPMIQESRALYEKTKGIPLIPIDAMGGYGTGSFQVMDYETSRYLVPEFSELNVDFMIRVKGSSMYPKYNSGDLVACKKLALKDIFFQWNKVYVLDTEQGAVIKRVKKGSDKEHIQLISDNVSYDPFELHLTEIYAIALVVGVIRLE